MDRMSYNLNNVQYQNEDLDAGYVNYPSTREQILGRLPKILIYAGLAVISIFYSCLTATSTPILFAAGMILASIFILRSVAEFLRMFKNKSNDYADKQKQLVLKSKLDKQRLIDFSVLLTFGLLLMVLGVTFILAPAFSGIFMHVHTVFKIGLSVIGAFFISKSISCLNSKLFRKRTGLIIKNLPDVLLYASECALGIFSLVLTEGFAIIPVMFTIVFALRTIASICHIFQQNRTARNLAIKLESISLGMIACTLTISGILFAPNVAVLIGISTLFVKITLLITGFLFTLSAVAKAWVGSKLKELEEASISFPSESDNKSFNVVTPLRKRKHKLSSKSAAPALLELDEQPEEKNVFGCSCFFC